MKSQKHIKQSIKQLNTKGSPQLHDRILTDLLKKLEQSKTTTSAPTQPSLWRTIMKNRIAKIATAAVIILAVVLSITFLDKAVTPAYAIEQTIEAGQNVRYLHFYFSSLDRNTHRNTTHKEAWLEYDDSGQIKHIRVDWYDQQSGNVKSVAVWSDGKTQYWITKENTLKFFEDESYTKKMLFFAKRYDPTSTVENMYELERKGDVEIEIHEPNDKTKPIILTCTWLPNTFLTEGKWPQMCEIVFVDQATKLVTSIELYQLMDGEYVDQGVWEYPDYDTLFEPGLFNLEEEAPVDVRHIDLMTLDVGLEQADLTEKEIAVEVVHSFLQALIAKDYDRAIKIYGYQDPDRKEHLLERFEKLNIVRIISIGDPVYPRRAASSQLEVPCIVELAEDGQIIEWQIEGVFVQRVIGHPKRWHIKWKFEK